MSLSHLQRYADLIESMIGMPAAFVPRVEDATHIQVERGLRGPIVALPIDREIAVVDAGGHARPVYRALLVYSWLLNGNPQPAVIDPWINSLPTGAWPALVRSLNKITSGDDPERRVLGAATPTNPAVRAVAKQDLTFADLVNDQQSNGAFLRIDDRANPETRWYDELILLHAAASYAVRFNDLSLQSAVEKNAQYHLHEIQPDHASAQPWGLLAFIQYAPPLADQVLHALSMQYPTGITGVPLLLLTDVLYGLRLLTMDHHDQPS